MACSLRGANSGTGARFAAAAMGALAAAHLLAAAIYFYRAADAVQRTGLGRLALLALVSAALAQGWWARCVGLAPGPRSDRSKVRWWLFMRCLLGGWVMSYAAALLAAEETEKSALFLALAAVPATLACLPMWADRSRLDRLLCLIERRPLRLAGWSLYLLLMVPLCTELALRVHGMLSGNPIPLAYRTVQMKLPAGISFGGRPVNSQGYWDEEFVSQRQAGVVRVALLGDETTLQGSWRTNFASQLEANLPHCELYHFGTPAADPRDYFTQAATDVQRFHPDLVLLVLSVATDLAEPESGAGPFDCRSLQTFQLGALCLARPEQLSMCRSWRGCCARSEHDFLIAAGKELHICRTPIDTRMQLHWQRIHSDLERLVAWCEARELPLTLVLVPGAYQVNPSLLQVLKRRGGYDEGALDLQLPQRQLDQFARAQGLQMIDLLPHLRACRDAPFQASSNTLSSTGHACIAEVLSRSLRRQLPGEATSIAQAR